MDDFALGLDKQFVCFFHGIRKVLESFFCRCTEWLAARRDYGSLAFLLFVPLELPFAVFHRSLFS